MRARARFQAYPFLTTAAFDITRPAELQRFEPRSFDLVIAANVLHATPDLDASVARLKTLLAPGGTLLLLEITRHPQWLDIVFGLMDGWWALADRQRRPLHPLMPGTKWAALLKERGFDNVAVFADTVAGEPAQSVIVGRQPTDVVAQAASAEAGVREKRWVPSRTRHVTWGEDSPRRSARGVRCAMCSGAGAERSTIDEREARLDDAVGVIHLRALDARHIADAVPVATKYLRAARCSRCFSGSRRLRREPGVCARW